MFTWNLHPTLLLIGILGFLPVGIAGIRRPSAGGVRASGATSRHIALQCVGLLCALGGYAAAYVLHELRGHAHLPPWFKPLSKQAHIYGGLLLLFLLLAVAGAGSLLARQRDGLGFLGLSEGSSLRESHSFWGLRVWVGLVVVCWLGIYMPLWEKAGANTTAPVLFLLLSGLYGVSTYKMCDAFGRNN